MPAVRRNDGKPSPAMLAARFPPGSSAGGAVNRFSQLFLFALGHGKKLPEDWAAFTWQILAVQGQKIVKEGKPLETAEENLAELTTQAHWFAVKLLPILKALQIA